MALSVVLNGQTRDFPNLDPPVPLAMLVQELALKSDRVAIERNGDIAERTRWAEIMLVSGDKLEVVHFVGGDHDWLAGPAGWSSDRRRSRRCLDE